MHYMWNVLLVDIRSTKKLNLEHKTIWEDISLSVSESVGKHWHNGAKKKKILI